MKSQQFSFGKPPWQGGCVFENQFTLRLAHRIHLDFQNLINMPNLRTGACIKPTKAKIRVFGVKRVVHVTFRDKKIYNFFALLKVIKFTMA